MRQYWSGDTIEKLEQNEIFVFGSNPEGRHGLGAALAAIKFGAQYGKGRGLHGQTYALVTKNLKPGFHEKATGITYATSGLRSVTLSQIKNNVAELYRCAEENPHLRFLITYRIEAKNLNGYEAGQFAQVFLDHAKIPDNVIFHESYKPMFKIESKAEKFTFFFQAQSPFSHWHPALFSYKDRIFTSCEQFMMYSKAKLFKDEVVADEIIALNNERIPKKLIDGEISRENIINDSKLLDAWKLLQKKVKALGRAVDNFDEELWVQKRVPIMRVANREKFAQNPDLRDFLLATEGTTLAEASKYDQTWGIGLEATDPRALDRSTWKGKNLCGECVQWARDQLLLNNTNEMRR